MSDDVKIPKGIALFLKSVLGVEPDKLMATLFEARKRLEESINHFDARLVALENQLRELRSELYDAIDYGSEREPDGHIEDGGTVHGPNGQDSGDADHG